MTGAKNLIDLPDKVLAEILSFLPNRFDLAQVCKKFYDVICESDKGRYKLKVGRQFNQVS